MLPKRNFQLNDDPYLHNAWDDPFISTETHIEKLNKLETHKNTHNNLKFISDPSHWDNFYTNHGTSFFKDRNWLLNSFPSINSGHVLELGCGVGNSMPHLMNATGIDFSHTAISLAKSRFPNFKFFVHNLTNTIELPQTDSVLMVFCLSAIDKSFHKFIFDKIWKCLKPGGKLFFKDYGYMDMVQLRYKQSQVVEENFYRRGDGTFTYFFKELEVKELAINSNFEIENLKVERKLLVNRKRKLEMYRVMIEGIFVKKI